MPGILTVLSVLTESNGADQVTEVPETEQF